MKRALLSGMLAMAIACPALAQPASPAPGTDDTGKADETIIVPGNKTTSEATHDFLKNYAAPAPLLGKLTRWDRRNPVCAHAGGFPSGYDRFTVNRIRDIAAMVGAPLSRKPDCKTNLAIIVTRDPQGLMSEVRANHPDLLGYYQSNAQADRLATMRFPVQVLYETVTIDPNGHIVRDTRFGDSPAGTGDRLRDGLTSAFWNVTIVVDAAKVDQFHLQMGALTDYLAMVALSQTDNFTPCQELPSIASLMAADCATGGLATAITSVDIAYLKGLYSNDPERTPIIQRGGIARDVEKSLSGGK